MQQKMQEAVANHRRSVWGAAQSGNAAAVRALFRKARHNNLLDCAEGFSPYMKQALCVAIANGHVDCVAALLKAGACATVHVTDGAGPVQTAAAAGDVDCLHLLLHARAQVGAHRPQDLVYPLDTAAAHGHVGFVNALVRARVSVQESHAAQHAAYHNHVGILELLASVGVNFNLQGACRGKFQGWCPIHAAARNGHVEAVQCLLRHKADVHAVTSSGLTALHIAARQGSARLVGFLLEAVRTDDPDRGVHARTHVGTQPLHEAAAGGHVDALRLLLRAKADIHATTMSGRMPLHEAVHHNCTAVFSLLVRAKANVDATYYNGITALHNAAVSGLTASVQMLLRLKADARVRAANGRSPCSYAAKRGHMDIVQMLQHAAAQP